MNFYFEAAGVLDKLDEKKGSVKGIIGALPAQNRKRVAALVLQTLKYKPVLNETIDATKLMKDEKRVLTGRSLALVLVHDVLLAKGGIQAGDGPLKQAILRHKTRLHAELTRAKIKRGARSNEDLIQHADPRAASIPRYVRVNTLKTTIEDALRGLESRGYTPGDESSGKTFVMDAHVPNLLAFDARAAMVDDPAYARGELILQDKASCFPALVLNPPSRDDVVVIDATAAPGNKTSHLAALMGNRGTLYALERDKRRFKTLETMLSRAGASNVRPRNVDFLSIDPAAKENAEYARATHILLDPSCSGSGIVNRLDYLLSSDGDEEADDALEERLERLAAFQQSMIAHAMTFPNVQRIVYSTCSVHATENERVVRGALLASEGKWVLAPRREVLPSWPRRGLPEELRDVEADAGALVRCMPGDDRTNGFFVSCFVRVNAAKRKATDEPQAAPKKKRKKKKKKAQAGAPAERPAGESRDSPESD